MVQDSNTSGISVFWRKIKVHVKMGGVTLVWYPREVFTKHRKFDLTCASRNAGNVCVITGGNRGIGFETTKKLLQCSLHVIIGCRKVAEGEAAVKLIRESGITTGKVDIFPLDLMSLKSVREFATQVFNTTSELHILINNAGVMLSPYHITEDGFESQFQVNYLSHFLLTNLLLPLLIKSGTDEQFSRIVNVSSVAHYPADIDFQDLQTKKSYSPTIGYANSKFMQIVSSNFLNNRFNEEKVKVTSNSLHPGIIFTDLFKNVGLAMALKPLFKLLLSNPDKGSDGVVYAALSPEIEGKGALFFANSQTYTPKRLALDPDFQKKLFDVSSELTEMKDSELFKKTFVSPVDDIELDESYKI